MSLRFRLIGLVCVVLLISLALAGITAYSNASRSVRTEMRAAFLVGRQTIESAVDRLRNAPEPSRDLDDLVASFQGNRHLRVRHAGEMPAVAAPSMEKSKLAARRHGLCASSEFRPRPSKSLSPSATAVTARS